MLAAPGGKILPAHARVILCIAAGLLALQGGCDSTAAGSGSSRDPSGWSWLGANGGTYWYVPSENLLAYQWDTDAPQSAAAINDQTVWHVERYDNGYIFGPVVVLLTGYPRVCEYATGSVTPDGRVYISFTGTTAIPSGTPSLTSGTGQLLRSDGAWSFNMQMASGSDTSQITHWAFMLQCTPSDSCWNTLPGVDQSILDALASCSAS
jgi:hypothetical protein